MKDMKLGAAVFWVWVLGAIMYSCDAETPEQDDFSAIWPYALAREYDPMVFDKPVTEPLLALRSIIFLM